MTDERTRHIAGKPESAKPKRASTDTTNSSTTPGAAARASDQPTAGHWLNLENAENWQDRSPTPGEAVAPTLGAQPPAEPPPVPMPTKIGKYSIVRELGRGGMGVVYQAEDTQLKRQAALKMVLAADFAAEDALRRFSREAETVARLQHPNIVQIYEIGTHENKP